jgi:oxygen-independent coproporphyrinogen-3 oxidase
MPVYFERELAALRGMADAGLVELQERAIQVTPAGWFLIRAIAMVFDRHLQAAQDRRRFSKVI